MNRSIFGAGVLLITGAAFLHAESFEFKISTWPMAPIAIAPAAEGVAVPQAQLPRELFAQAGLDFASVDVDALEKYDAAAVFEKSGALPLVKRQAWQALAESFPAYAAVAAKRAGEWYKYAEDCAAAEAAEFENSPASAEEKAAKWAAVAETYPGLAQEARKREAAWRKYAAELAIAARAKHERRAAMARDYSKLMRLAALSVVAEADKRRFAVMFADAYGKRINGNPYIAELQRLLPEGYLSEAETADIDKSRQAMPDMAYIPAGPFLMGGAEPEAENDEKPQHTVYTGPYYLDKYEVTVGQIKEFARLTERQMRAQWSWSSERHPAVNMTWHDARAYCKWLGKRLPTEAEWEKAARGGTTAKYSFGPEESALGDYAWYNANSPYRSDPVGQKKPNAYGLHDIYGNAWEWVADWYGAGYYAGSPEDDPKGPEAGTVRGMRGGSWRAGPKDLRAANRAAGNPDDAVPDVGFRCLLPAKDRE